MLKRLALFLLALTFACSQAPTEPASVKGGRPNFAITRVTLTPATVASRVGDLDTLVASAINTNGTVCGGCIITWTVLDPAKLTLVSTFKPAGATGAAVIRSTVAGTGRVKALNNSKADTTTFTISDTVTPPDTNGVRAAQADSFVNSISVQLHLGQGGIYDQFTTIVKPRLLELGVRHIRERMFNDAGTQSQQQDLAANGIQMTGGCWPIGTNYTDASHCLAYANAYGTGVIDAFDGWNEVNGQGLADWETAWVTWQQTMFNAYNGDPTWNNRPVLANSFTSSSATQQLATDKGNQSGKVDKGNMHSYPGGSATPTGVLSQWITAQNAVTSPKPIWVTETGYHTCVPNCPDGTGVSELAQAKYTPRIYFEDWNKAIERTNLYELLDEGPASNPTDTRENHWGLVHYDGSVKPSFTAMKNLIALLADPGASFAAGKLNYTLTNALTTTHTTLLQKRNGRFYLAIWQDLNVYDPAAEVDRTNAADALTLTFATSKSAVNVFTPRTGTTGTALGGGTSFSLSVPDEVMVVEVIP